MLYRGSKSTTVTALLVLILAVIAPPVVVAQTSTPVPTLVIPTPDPSAQDIPAVQATTPYRLLLLVPFRDEPFWQEVEQAVTARAAQDGVTVDVNHLNAPSVPEQLNQINQAIAAGYSGILLGPVDASAIAPGIAAANAAGIPVLALDTAPTEGGVISVVRTDNVAASRLAGQFIANELDGEGKVLNFQGLLSDVVAQERDQGLHEALDPFSEITVISEAGEWETGRGFVQTSGFLPQAGEGTPAPLPLIDAVFAANPAMTLGAAQAIENVQADTVFVVGFGASTETVAAVKNGTIEAIVIELPKRLGAIAVDMMTRHLNGEQIPQVVDSGFTLVTRDTIDRYIEPSS
jgi:ribose transport system substrate-binding protein